MANLAALKKSSSKALLEKLQKTVAASDTKKTFEKDERMWQPDVDDAGNGSAVIRFLPAADEDADPYVKAYAHGFKVGNKWFIEDCPSTLGKWDQCPACEMVSELYNTGLESDKQIAGQRKRKVSYYANVLIIKDPANPQNEGQVKIFRFGQKIFDKIKEAINPDEMSGDEPITPFDFFDGANFVIKISKVSGFKNYDKSKFASKSELFDGDVDQLREVLDKIYPLDEFVAESKFKTRDELQAKLDTVMGSGTTTRGSVSVSSDDRDDDDVPFESKPAAEKSAKVEESNDDEGDLQFFKDLAKGATKG